LAKEGSLLDVKEDQSSNAFFQVSLSHVTTITSSTGAVVLIMISIIITTTTTTTAAKRSGPVFVLAVVLAIFLGVIGLVSAENNSDGNAVSYTKFLHRDGNNRNTAVHSASKLVEAPVITERDASVLLQDNYDDIEFQDSSFDDNDVEDVDYYDDDFFAFLRRPDKTDSNKEKEKQRRRAQQSTSTRVNIFQKLGESIGLTIVGCCLIAFMPCLIWWNEGRHVDQLSRIDFCKNNAVAVDWYVARNKLYDFSKQYYHVLRTILCCWLILFLCFKIQKHHAVE
jgi:hypothetical protein